MKCFEFPATAYAQTLAAIAKTMDYRFKVPAVLLLLCGHIAHGQIVNTLSQDETNMYVHAIDSVTRIIIQSATLKRITVFGDRSITQTLPSTIEGIVIARADQKNTTKQKIKKDEARFVVRNVQIIRDQFKIAILTWGHDGRLGDGAYVFRYKYIPETMTYELKEIERGIQL